ncbi:ABC transporter substrate-binding protein [Bacillus sp. UMB0899]|uniref:ABC transporter substrate-binding protein n=1 Tax=Metabacillus schmidteae TaxID=2730405 RepID=UPI000C7FDBD7|nr:sugar ABC transporter substrate-binding protein [Metabacillus schmidteae]PMC40700.1 ABC transporter substrate-binding protein [Bacillus sp. UMB0899]
MKKRVVIIGFIFFIIAIAGYLFSLFLAYNKDQNIIHEESEDIIQLQFWRNYGTKLENDAYKNLITSFEKKHPHIRINMVSVPYGDYELRLRTEIAAGSPPDIMSIDSPNLALYAHSGSLLSIDQWMKSEGNIDDFPPSTLEGLKYNGEIYLSPVVESGVALFYNIHLFKQAGIPIPSQDPNKPLTWTKVLEIAKELNDPTKEIFGIDPAQGFSDGESPAYFKLPLLWQFGSDVLDLEANTAEGYLNSDQALEALQFYQDLYHKHKVAAVELPPDPFVSGHLAMSVMGSWTLADFEKNFPEFKLGEDFGVAPLPKETYQVTPNGGWALGISTKSEHPQEAWEFIKYVTSFEGSVKYVEMTGDLPARYSVADEFSELNNYPKNIFVHQTQNYSENRPVTPVYPVISDAIKDLFEDVGIGGKDVETSANEAVKKINKSLQDIKSRE